MLKQTEDRIIELVADYGTARADLKMAGSREDPQAVRKEANERARAVITHIRDILVAVSQERKDG